MGVVHIYSLIVQDHEPRLELIGRLDPSPTDSFLRSRITAVKLSPCSRFLAVGMVKGVVTVYSMQKDRNVVFNLELQHNEHRVVSLSAKIS